MSTKIAILLTFILMSFASSCSQAQQQKSQQTDKTTLNTPKFILPDIPVTLTDPSARAEYLVSNYWAKFNFADKNMVGNDSVVEQALVDFIIILPEVPITTACAGINKMMQQASTDSLMYDYFVNLSEKYLYDPNSPYRNEDYYIPVLQHITENKRLSSNARLRYEHHLSMALKNRVGSKATDFSFVKKSGDKVKLSQLIADYTIIFFNNPDCEDCKRVKAMLNNSNAINEMLHRKDGSRLAIVSIYPDDDIELWKRTEYSQLWINGRSKAIENEELYDIKAIPTLYLLDKEKRVVMKDASVEQIINYLTQIQSNR